MLCELCYSLYFLCLEVGNLTAESTCFLEGEDEGANVVVLFLFAGKAFFYT